MNRRTGRWRQLRPVAACPVVALARLAAQRALIVAAAFAVIGCSAARSRAPAADPVNNPTIDFSAPERDSVRAALPEPMPAIPADSALHPFQVSATTTNTFGIDPASLRVLGHRIVQFTLVVESPGGVRNIGYDAIDCETGRFQMLAIGQDGQDGEGWSTVHDPQWRGWLTGDTVNAQYRELSRSWCDGRAVAGQPAELLHRLDTLPARYLNNQ